MKPYILAIIPVIIIGTYLLIQLTVGSSLYGSSIRPGQLYLTLAR